MTDSVVDDNQGSGVLADVEDGGVADLAADRNAFVGNLWDGLATCNGGSTILASSNIALANSVGFMRCGGERS